jgi:hypothetical protein
MVSRIAILPALVALQTCGLAIYGLAQNVSPTELVRQTVQNEIRSNNGNARFMYQDQKQTLQGSQISLIVETAQGSAEMLLTENGKPLPPQKRQAEEARLEGLAHNPAELRKKQKADREDSEHTNRIIKALPDAFIFEPDGTEIGREGIGHPGDQLVRLKFSPNPKYSAPSHTEQVLTGMSGYVLIDASRKRIAKMDGKLFKDVGFGWGILGRLDPGGQFIVQQGTVKDNDWEVTRMDLSFTGKVLMFKKLVIKSDECFTDFRPAPSDLSFAQAVELLKKQGSEIAENQRSIPQPAR